MLFAPIVFHLFLDCSLSPPVWKMRRYKKKQITSPRCVFISAHIKSHHITSIKNNWRKMTIVKSAQGTTKIKSIILSWIIVWVTNFQNKVLHLIRHLMKFRIRITFCINDRRVRERERKERGEVKALRMTYELLKWIYINELLSFNVRMVRNIMLHTYVRTFSSGIIQLQWAGKSSSLRWKWPALFHWVNSHGSTH